MAKHDKFWNLVHKNPGDGCWVWLGAWDRQYGYGKYTVADLSRPCGTRSATPHKYAWEEAMGRSVTPGMELDHTCRVKLCVRPSHLEEVTHIVNKKRARLRFCKRGHPQTPENRYHYGKGLERCKLCIPLYRKEMTG